MICNLYLDSGYFTKHPFENGDPDLVDGLVTLWITKSARRSVAAWNLMASHLFRNLDFLLAFIFTVNYSSMHEETKRTLIAFWLGSEPLRKKESNSEERKHDSNLFYPNPTPTPLFLTPTPRWHSDDASSPTFTHPDSQIPIFFAEHELRWVNWCPNIDGIWPKPSPAWASSCRCDARLKNLLDYCTYVCKSDTKQYVLGDFGRWKHTFLYEFFFGKHSELKHRMQYSRPR